MKWASHLPTAGSFLLAVTEQKCMKVVSQTGRVAFTRVIGCWHTSAANWSATPVHDTLLAAATSTKCWLWGERHSPVLGRNCCQHLVTRDRPQLLLEISRCEQRLTIKLWHAFITCEKETFPGIIEQMRPKWLECSYGN